MKQRSQLKFSIVTLTTYVIMMMVTEVLQLVAKHWWEPIVSLSFNIVFYAVCAWTLCAMAAMVGRKWGHVIHAAGHLAVGLYAFSTIFLVMKFHRHWDAFTLQFLHETNKEEAQSFLSAFLFDWHTLALLLGTAVFFFAEGWLQRRVAQLPLFPKSRWKKVALAGAVAVVGVNALFFSTDADRNYDLAAKLHTPVKRNALWNLWQSHLKYGEFKKEFERCADVQKQYREQPSCQEREADVVLIIGESFNKHFSNLYDGKYNTNPLLAKRLEEGEEPAGTEKGKLFVFNDVISSDNGTTQNFKYFLSMASVADKKKGISWCDQPLFPTILRSCGFNVVYFSNQFAPNDNLGQWDASMGFVNHPGIEPYIFDHRNNQKFAYDLELVNDFSRQRQTLERPNRNFCIFHLFGQHTYCRDRYPEGFSRFKAEDVEKHYAMRPDSKETLNKAQREEVAAYLNATAYNDLVVDSIIRLFNHRNAIVIYLSDHGEEVHNFRRQYSRTDLATDVAEALPCQLDIPLLVYLTPRYRALHPDVCRRLAAATNRRFMSDDLPQMIFDILGVSSRHFKPQRSVINDHYQAPHHRILQNGRRYD